MSAESQLPRTADGSPAGYAAPTGKAPSRSELQDEVTRVRAELASTVDALSLRLSPGYQAQRVKSATTTAAHDAKAFFTGAGMPAGDDRRARNVKVLLGAAAAVAAVVALSVIRRVRR